ncbi:hypothetical protein BGW36DRAFT_429716 [Talaromyces proteolyticus]|uniref:Sulfatase N-terminal domain-containing protein n=1 Tax=Talaromyces proteolyticus TaxID=1131652 RepID=A0AAD4KR05_9EURO|nr:uncharacterized protein BGW36DRAFT_429716 [Talaromyces proteolyticus]KAH8693677.1 hypothetical protein BGW36DRAFT_429716 [Talaromyces proteolyticus]
MKTIEEARIANETLVVFVGDHGQAFAEDSHITETFENGHISNYRVPLVFRHPLLPRINVAANASSVAILPTILDLLIYTDSLNDIYKDAASGLIHEYEDQSLILPYKAAQNGREAWNIGIISTGGTVLGVASAAVPYRLVLPLTEDFTYIFSGLSQDPNGSTWLSTGICILYAIAESLIFPTVSQAKLNIEDGVWYLRQQKVPGYKLDS